jgi:biotin operon repressor
MKRESQVELVKKMMQSKEWVTLYDLARELGASDAGVSARIRDLRKYQHGRHIIVKRKRSAHVYEYRMVI